MLRCLKCLVLLCLPVLSMAQHSISGTFAPADKYKMLVLYKVSPESSEYVTNSPINEDGTFSIELDSTAEKGMYKLVYALPRDEYSFDLIYDAKEDIKLEFDQETGVKYKASIENTLVSSYTYSMSLVSQSIGKFYSEQSTDSLALVSIFETQRTTQKEYENAAEGTIGLAFIEANRPYIPTAYEDIKTYIGNLKAHFFDHVDFNNEILQSSNFLTERMLNYIYGMTSKETDDVTTYKTNIDTFYGVMTKADPKVKVHLLEVLWEQMAEGNQDEVAVYIADTYLIDLAKALPNQQLVQRLEVFKKVALGQTAPNFEIDAATKLSLLDIDSYENYLVVFWSSTCSHCLAEIPEVYNYVKGLGANHVKVIAIGLEDDATNWEKEIVKYPEFQHILGLGKWNHPLVNAYNVSSTPSYFILDKDKTIVSKPFDFKALQEYLEPK